MHIRSLRKAEHLNIIEVDWWREKYVKLNVEFCAPLHQTLTTVKESLIAGTALLIPGRVSILLPPRESHKFVAIWYKKSILTTSVFVP